MPYDLAASFSDNANVREVPDDIAERLIVALDVRTPTEARALVTKLDGIVSFYKIGLWLLFAEGTDRLIDELIAEGKDIFLDYKIYDIPQTVEQAVLRAKERRIKFITVHGDPDIMGAAVRAKGTAQFPKIFTITVLTSMGDDDLREMGYAVGVSELIALRVRNSLQSGCDGIIASPADDPNMIRQLANNQRLLIATPGVRSEGVSRDDQKRTATPTEAIRNGADYIVMGRQIINASDPAAEARKVIAEMELGREAPNV